MASTQESVRIWLAKKPHLLEALGMGVVNSSALARLAREDVGGGFEAVKKALIRQGETIRAEGKGRRRRVEALLKGSSFEIRSAVAVVLSSEPPGIPPLAQMRTPHGWTTVALEGDLPPEDGKGQAARWQVRRRQCLIAISSGIELEETPFVLSHLLAALEREGINLTEFVSCREDTLLVVDAVDGPAAHRVLSSLMTA